jgi:hypothetical protein
LLQRLPDPWQVVPGHDSSKCSIGVKSRVARSHAISRAVTSIPSAALEAIGSRFHGHVVTRIAILWSLCLPCTCRFYFHFFRFLSYYDYECRTWDCACSYVLSGISSEWNMHEDALRESLRHCFRLFRLLGEHHMAIRYVPR